MASPLDFVGKLSLFSRSSVGTQTVEWVLSKMRVGHRHCFFIALHERLKRNLETVG